MRSGVVVFRSDRIITTPVSLLDRKLGNQQTGDMKTTLDLPDSLMKLVKLRAVREGRKLKDTVAELLRIGLAEARRPMPSGTAKPVMDKSLGLPVLMGHKATPEMEMTPDRVAEILLQQEVEWANVAGR
jgi:plasmid stability protein